MPWLVGWLVVDDEDDEDAEILYSRLTYRSTTYTYNINSLFASIWISAQIFISSGG